MSQIITYTDLTKSKSIGKYHILEAREYYKNKIYTTKSEAEKVLKKLKQMIKRNPKLREKYFNLRMRRIG